MTGLQQAVQCPEKRRQCEKGIQIFTVVLVYCIDNICNIPYSELFGCEWRDLRLS